MPRQERIKTAVIAKRSDFRTSIVSYLNQTGFAAEKRMLSELEELEPLLGDELLWNFVVDLHDATLQQGREFLKKLTEMVNDSRIHPLVYLAEGSGVEAEALAADFPGCAVVSKPISRKHLVDALVKPYMARHGHLKKVRKPDSSENSLILETIVHVKDTIESLKIVAADRSKISEVIRIGQKFNGVYSTFTFFSACPGYSELSKMAEVIDSVAITYSGEVQDDTLNPQHFDIMVDSAKAAFNLLKMMRDGENPDEVMLKRVDGIYKRFQAASDLKKRNTASQDEVDALLDKLGI